MNKRAELAQELGENQKHYESEMETFNFKDPFAHHIFQRHTQGGE